MSIIINVGTMRVCRVIAIALAGLMLVSCASHKGSSSLGTTKRTTASASPKVKNDAQLAMEKAAAEEAAEKARRAAQAAEQQARAEAEAKAREAEEAARKAMAEAKAKAAAEEAAIAAAAKAKVEKVKVIESSIKTDGKYHVVVGSFKSLANARTACETLVEQGYTPNIVENEDGMYRVTVFNEAAEDTARKKLAQVKIKYPQYDDAWLLIEK